MSKPIPNPVWITVSGEVHKRLEAFAIAPMDTSQTTFHADGRATFPVTQETAARLKGFNPYLNWPYASCSASRATDGS